MYAQLFELHATLLKALAHPRRLEIVQLLRDQELPVSDIHTMLQLPQANISQHLMILRDAGVLEDRRQGKQVWYKLADSRILQACDALREVLIDQRSGTGLADQLHLTMKELTPLVIDPVCQMRLSPKTAGYHQVFKNTSYYFCASGCLHKFKESPTAYAHE